MRRIRDAGPRTGAVVIVMMVLSLAPAVAEEAGHASSAAARTEVLADPARVFYVRAGAGSETSRGTRFLDRDCMLDESNNPGGYQALYGCGSGPDGKPYQSRGDFGTLRGFELGIGYAPPSSFLRLEGLVQQRSGVTFRGKANFLASDRRQDVHAEVSALAVMLAGYLDFPEIDARPVGVVTPFVGAGMGQSRIEVERMTMEFPGTRTLVPGGSRTNFAWMASAGISLPLSERVMLELAWRYTDLGTVETGRGGGSVVWRDGSREPLSLNVPETEADLAGHGLWVSLRYAF